MRTNSIVAVLPYTVSGDEIAAVGVIGGPGKMTAAVGRTGGEPLLAAAMATLREAGGPAADGAEGVRWCYLGEVTWPGAEASCFGVDVTGLGGFTKDGFRLVPLAQAAHTDDGLALACILRLFKHLYTTALTGAGGDAPDLDVGTAPEGRSL